MIDHPRASASFTELAGAFDALAATVDGWLDLQNQSGLARELADFHAMPLTGHAWECSDRANKAAKLFTIAQQLRDGAATELARQYWDSVAIQLGCLKSYHDQLANSSLNREPSAR